MGCCQTGRFELLGTKPSVVRQPRISEIVMERTRIEERFNSVAQLIRLTGFLFIEKRSKGGTCSFTTSFWSWSSVYGLLVVGSAMMWEAALLYFKVKGDMATASFKNAVFDTLIVILNVRSFFGVTMVLVFSKKLAQILTSTNRFSSSLLRNPKVKTKRVFARRLRYVIRLLGLSAVAFTRFHSFEDLRSGLPGELAELTSSAWSLLTIVVIGIAVNSLHALILIVSDECLDCLIHLRNLPALRLSSESLLCQQRTTIVLEELRLKYLKLREILQEVNVILRYSTTLFALLCVMGLCTCAFIMAESRNSLPKIFFLLGCAIIFSAELVEITLSSATLRHEVSSTYKTPVFEE